MTIQEATKVIYMIHAVYPQDRKATEEELLDRIDAWAVFFADYPFPIVDAAVKTWIKSASYMPTPEEIKRACDTRVKFEKLISNAGYINEAPDISPEMEAKLDELVAFLIEGEART